MGRCGRSFSVILFREPMVRCSFSFCAIVARAWRVWKTARVLEFSGPGTGRQFYGVASFVEALCWLLSWFPGRVWWSGRWWRVDFAGKLSRAE